MYSEYMLKFERDQGDGRGFNNSPFEREVWNCNSYNLFRGALSNKIS